MLKQPEPPFSAKIKDKFNLFILSVSKLGYFKGNVKYLKLFQKLLRRSEFYDNEFDYSAYLRESLLHNLGFTMRDGKPVLCIHCGNDNISFYLDPHSFGACEECKCNDCGGSISTRINSSWY
jgi:hypothetical protein